LLEIDVEQEQYIGALTVEAGIRVLLHGQGHMIFPYEEGFSVSPGMSTSVGIKKVSEIQVINALSALHFPVYLARGHYYHKNVRPC
jgi:hypothetical protein